MQAPTDFDKLRAFVALPTVTKRRASLPSRTTQTNGWPALLASAVSGSALNLISGVVVSNDSSEHASFQQRLFIRQRT